MYSKQKQNYFAFQASGKWIGFYIKCKERHPFEVDLSFTSETVSGEGVDSIGTFSISGTWKVSNGEIKFSKIYHNAHSVDYIGVIRNSARSISGTYSSGGHSDIFSMSLENTQFLTPDISTIFR